MSIIKNQQYKRKGSKNLFRYSRRFFKWSHEVTYKTCKRYYNIRLGQET